MNKNMNRYYVSYIIYYKTINDRFVTKDTINSIIRYNCSKPDDPDRISIKTQKEAKEWFNIIDNKLINTNGNSVVYIYDRITDTIINYKII